MLSKKNSLVPTKKKKKDKLGSINILIMELMLRGT